MPENVAFRIAIVGGGIGGLFCALAIHHHCTSTSTAPNIPVTINVYEQATQYKEIGAGVGIGVNAAKLIHELGIGRELNAIAGDRAGVWISFRRFDDGGEIVTVPGVERGEVRQASCARAEFLDLLREAVEERGAATLHTRKACTGVEDQGNTALIHFSDSTTASADLVIACDGIHSPIRNQFSPDKPLFSGTIAYRGVIPINSISSWPFRSYSACWCAKGRHFLVFPIAANRDLNIVAFVTKGEEEVADVKESWTSICERREVEEDFAGFDGCVQELISLMPDRPSRWRINDRRPLDRWWYLGGKVVLLGDAAHAMTPHLGAGAGQSMEDGWILGRALSDYLSGRSSTNPHFASLSSTAQLYQDVRLPRAQKVQLTSRAAGNTYEMQAEDMLDKTFDECVPMLEERTRARMKWVWEEDLDAAYVKMRDGVLGEIGHVANGSNG